VGRNCGGEKLRETPLETSFGLLKIWLVDVLSLIAFTIPHTGNIIEI
jgi:hypothetical protein